MQQKQPRIVALACIALLLSGACAPARAQATLADVKASFGRPSEPPAKSIVDLAAIAIGQTLFFSTKLSATGTASRGSCHEPVGAWRDGRARSLDDQGIPLARHPPSLEKLAWASSSTSGGRVATLELQATDSVVSRRMGALPGKQLARLWNEETQPKLDETRSYNYPAPWIRSPSTTPEYSKFIPRCVLP